MKEVSRSIMKSDTDAQAGDPAALYATDAEIVVDDNGEKVYLHT